MKPGDVVDVEGYEVVAQVAYADGPGHFILAHNNSSHILLFDQPDGESLVYYMAAWPYFESEGDYEKAYELALWQAVGLALRH